MNSLFDNAELAVAGSDLRQRVYTSRLLGRDKALVLHGGGNTSVKTIQKNAFGEEEEILLVKGSGWDLEKIEPEGFSPVKLAHLQRLALRRRLSDIGVDERAEARRDGVAQALELAAQALELGLVLDAPAARLLPACALRGSARCRRAATSSPKASRTISGRVRKL
jgi:hypothetical protein